MNQIPGPRWYSYQGMMRYHRWQHGLHHRMVDIRNDRIARIRRLVICGNTPRFHVRSSVVFTFGALETHQDRKYQLIYIRYSNRRKGNPIDLVNVMEKDFSQKMLTMMSFPTRMLFVTTVVIIVVNLIVFYWHENLSFILVLAASLLEIIAISVNYVYWVPQYKLKWGRN